MYCINISLIFILIATSTKATVDESAFAPDSYEEIPFTPQTTTLSPVRFSIEGPSNVQLPTTGVTFRVVFDDPDWSSLHGPWSFYWVPLDGVGQSYADAYDKSVLELTKLKPGKLRYQVTVKSGTLSGSKEKDLEVLPELTENLPPHAVVKPASPVNIFENSQLVLDAEGSRDEDGKIQIYEWHLKKGPSVQLPTALNTPILTLNNLQPGNYTFSLKVTDDKGAFDETDVDVIVTEERDDPPKARISRCGDSAVGSITVRLPLDELHLCGNSSTDDIKIEQYSWARVDNLSNLPVDYQGSTTSILKLTNLQSNELFGPYIFQLEVFDSKQQKDTTKISIFVNKAENQAPKVNAGKNMTLILSSETAAILDGGVDDDGTIVEYKWIQIDGPSQASILNDDKAKATATNLQEGIYQFEFVAIDDAGLNGTDHVFVTVERSHNQPPIARANNVTVTLPRTFASLNASLSSDDAGIVEYKWRPFDNVPACISALDNSENQAVLFLNGLVEGEFLFNLTVFDQQKESDVVTVKLTVINGNERLNSVEIYMDQKIEDITYRLRRKFEARLSAALTAQISEASTVFVHFTDFGQDPKTGNLRVVFHAEYTAEEPVARQTRDPIPPKLEIVEVRRAVAILQKENVMIQEFSIKEIEPLYCQRSCSHHGRCNDFTKECECETYWMGSLFTTLSSGKQLDCSWSKLYFVITICFFFSISLMLLGCSTAMRRRIRRYPLCNKFIPCLSHAKDRLKRKRFRRRKRYEPLDTEGKSVINMLSSSSLHSDSDEGLFDSKTVRERNFRE